MIKRSKICLLLCALTAIAFAPVAHAQTQNTQFESIGLYDTGHKDSLGTGIYHQSSRTGLTKLLEQNKRSHWIAVEKTINNFLLTTADASALRNDIDIQAGKDLFTLRLNALLKRGLNKQVFDLFTKIPEESTQESLAFIGVLSMLLNKEKALACLETKTLLPHFKGNKFWQELDAYCTLSLSKQIHTTAQTLIDNSDKVIISSILKDPDYRFEYTPATFSALSPLERALLTAEERIAITTAFKDTPPQHIPSLLLQTHISDEAKVLLTMQAVKHGILNITSLTALYESLNENTAHIKGIGEIIRLYGETKGSWIPKKRKKRIEKAFSIAKDYGDLALLPFLPILLKMEPGDDLSLDNTKRTIHLSLYSDLTIPPRWIKDLHTLSIKGSKNKDFENLRSQVLYATILLTNSTNEDHLIAANKAIKPYLLSNNTLAALKNITDAIDITPHNNGNVPYIYENDFDLLQNRSYTMPPSILLDALRQSSENQDLGGTLFLSSIILSGIEHKELYLGTLGDISIALSKTGLKQVSLHLLAQAILEIEN
ncbi:MAG: hypothetical protein COA45_00420 [Zetaproteobacteria bacterium]|nr:MAG: hypothetical protein COA45_00420 [Zetaproteobacteria bacterium]